MCRLLGYLGPQISLDAILCKPEHSLIVQSYQPREMTSGVVNADGFGLGWYHTQRDAEPFTYKNMLPIWGDINLSSLSRYVESGCILGYVRSATAGQGVDLSNCQPFQHNRLLFVHNGFIKNFRQTLYRPLRTLLNDQAYQLIQGTTDSEHIFGLIITEITEVKDLPLEQAVYQTLKRLTTLAESAESVEFSANLLVSDGQQLIASRYALGSSPPSLYWLRDDPNFPEAVIIASEPLFAGNWHSCPAQSLIRVGKNLDVNLYSIP